MTDNQMEEVKVIEVNSSEIVYQQDKATIDSQVATAKAYPRSVKKSMEDAMAIVALNSEVAAECIYSLPRGGKAITGPSVHLAKIIAQTWGNLRIEAKVVDVSEKHVTSQAVAFDLEKNIAIKVEVKRSIIGKTGRFNDDMITVTGNAANSIALRNAVLSIIPRQVVDQVYKVAKDAITGDISDETKFLARKQVVMEKLKSTYKVTEDEILAAIGKASVDHIDPDDLVTLIGVGQAIKDGDTTIQDAFRPINKKDPQAVAFEKEAARIKKHIANAKNEDDLGHVVNLVAEYGLTEMFEAKVKELNAQ